MSGGANLSSGELDLMSGGVKLSSGELEPISDEESLSTGALELMSPKAARFPHEERVSRPVDDSRYAPPAVFPGGHRRVL